MEGVLEGYGKGEVMLDELLESYAKVKKSRPATASLAKKIEGAKYGQEPNNKSMKGSVVKGSTFYR